MGKMIGMGHLTLCHVDMGAKRSLLLEVGFAIAILNSMLLEYIHEFL